MKHSSPLSRVRRSTAPGGVPLIVESSPDLPLVHFMIGLRAGASLDPMGREGLTRFTARLMRRTAGGLPCATVDQVIEGLGGSVGVDVGTTSVLLHGSVISRSYEEFAALLLDVIARPGYLPEELERLRRETLSELVQARDDDRYLARRAFKRRVFGHHELGRSVSGTLASVAEFDEQQVRGLAARLLRRNLAFVALSGDVSAAQAESFAQRIGESLADSPAEELPRIEEPTVPGGRRLVFVDKPERTQTQIFIGGLGTHPLDGDHAPLYVANTVFGGTFTSRLTEEVRGKRGWSYGAYSSLPYGKTRQSFSMWTFPKASDAAACIALEIQLLEQWCDRGITKKELASAKRYLVRSHAFAVDTATKRVGLAVEPLLVDLPVGYHEEYIDRIEAVTLDDANLAIRSRIDPQNLLFALVGTHQDIGAQVADAIPRLLSTEVVPFDADE